MKEVCKDLGKLGWLGAGRQLPRSCSDTCELVNKQLMASLRTYLVRQRETLDSQEQL